MNQALVLLKERLAMMTDLNLTSSILNWDQTTMMPDGGSDSRGRQMATLAKLSHSLLVSEETGELIRQITPWAQTQPQENMDAAFVHEAARLRNLEVNVPSSLNSEMTEHYSRMYTAWTIARPNDDFAALKPLLVKSVELSKKFSDCFKNMDHPMDALIQYADFGVTVKSAKQLFSELRSQLVPLVKRVTSANQIDSSCLQGDFDETAQLEFCKTVARQLGYDFNRGRLDLSAHPFMTRLSGNDVRITTRAIRTDLTDCLFSVIHEVGHALYEFGINPVLDGNILAGGVSSGVHESQSRLWENHVGRGKPFWDYFYPILQKNFPHFEKFSQSHFIRAINKVDPGFIRVDADELTYNLHVMIRFDLECQLLEGTLSVRDLPDAWNARYKSDLGISVPNMKNGCLQDVHWFGGRLGGAFQGYTIGNILSAQLYDTAHHILPNMEQDFVIGDFSKLKAWLNTNIHQWGASISPDRLIKLSTHQDLSIHPYMTYLSEKYSSLYNL